MKEIEFSPLGIGSGAISILITFEKVIWNTLAYKICSDCICWLCLIWLPAAPRLLAGAFAARPLQSRGEEKKWRSRLDRWRRKDHGEGWHQGSLPSSLPRQMLSLTRSPRGTGEVPRQHWLQNQKWWSRCASSSPCWMDHDINADQEWWCKILDNHRR